MQIHYKTGSRAIPFRRLAPGAVFVKAEEYSTVSKPMFYLRISAILAEGDLYNAVRLNEVPCVVFMDDELNVIELEASLTIGGPK